MNLPKNIFLSALTKEPHRKHSRKMSLIKLTNHWSLSDDRTRYVSLYTHTSLDPYSENSEWGSGFRSGFKEKGSRRSFHPTWARRWEKCIQTRSFRGVELSRWRRSGEREIGMTGQREVICPLRDTVWFMHSSLRMCGMGGNRGAWVGLSVGKRPTHFWSKVDWSGLSWNM